MNPNKFPYKKISKLWVACQSKPLIAEQTDHLFTTEVARSAFCMQAL